MEGFNIAVGRIQDGVGRYTDKVHVRIDVSDYGATKHGVHGTLELYDGDITMDNKNIPLRFIDIAKDLEERFLDAK